jgi:protein-S-isoprenylcysteine O-methyltransferase Ste14
MTLASGQSSGVGMPAANIVLALWLVSEAVRLAIFGESIFSDATALLTVLALGAGAYFVLRRPKPVSQDISFGTVAIVAAATVWPVILHLQAGMDAAPSRIIQWIQAAALLVTLMAFLYLGRNFSLVPQYRSIVRHGPYALVRHPLYAAYLIFDATLVVMAGTPVALLLWLIEAGLLLLRARQEENLLARSDDAYRAYLRAVRYRFLPFVI